MCKQTFETYDGLKQHLVEAHGFTVCGESVFLRQTCHCGKPGLYKVGKDAYCKDHRHEAVQRRVRVGFTYDQRAGEREATRKAFNQQDLARRKFHQACGR